MAFGSENSEIKKIPRILTDSPKKKKFLLIVSRKKREFYQRTEEKARISPHNLETKLANFLKVRKINRKFRQSITKKHEFR